MRRTAWILTGATVIVGTITFLIGLGIVNQASQITGETVSVLVAQVDIP
ncbi:hypothetical protein [Thermoflexus sp.]|nr:hypothetical protein [Thermoflexus sp.]